MLAAVLYGGTAHAEPNAQEKETARALMDQGDERFEAKNFEGALEAYTGAHAIMRVPTTAIEVAKAHEALGHLTEARDALLEAVRFPKTANESEAFTSARADAAKRAEALTPRIPSVSLHIEGVPPGEEVHVSVDKFNVPAVAMRLPIKVNPGHHVIHITGDAIEDAMREFDVKEAESITTDISVVARPVESRFKKRNHDRSVLGTVGLATAGVGVAGLAIGGILGFRASAKQDEAGCPDNRCPDDHSANTLRDAGKLADISTVVFVASGVVAAAGITLFVLFSGDDKKSASRSVHDANMGRWQF